MHDMDRGGYVGGEEHCRQESRGAEPGGRKKARVRREGKEGEKITA